MLTIIVRWIGWDVELERTHHSKNMKIEGDNKKEETVTVEPLVFPENHKEDRQSKKFMCNKKNYKFDRYGLDKDGKAISVDSYCLKLATNKSTYVILQ